MSNKLWIICLIWCFHPTKILTSEISNCIQDDAYYHFTLTQCSNVTSLSTLKIGFSTNDIENLVIYDSTIRKISPNTSLEKLPELKRLTLAFLGIEEIEPQAFRNFARLINLNLRNNKITTLPARAFGENLRFLDLRENSISSFDPEAFQGMTHLEQIDLDKNRIKDLGENLFKDCTNLATFNAANNEIHVVNSRTFQGARNLGQLRLSQNPHLEISEPFPKLGTLDVGGVGLTVLPDFFFNSTQIIDFGGANNRIKHLNPKWFGKGNPLRTMDVSHNEISHIDDLPTLENLEMLLIGDNFLTILPANLSSILPNLNYLNVTGSKIKKIETNTFTNLRRLREVDLEYNEISHLSENSFATSGLENLLLGHNNLTILTNNIFGSCPNLTWLQLSDNKIERIEPNVFVNLPMLRVVSLSNNRLNTIPDGLFETNFELGALDISHNEIAHLTPHLLGDRFTYTTFRIDVSSNKLEDIPLEMFKYSERPPCDRTEFEIDIRNTEIAKDKIEAILEYFLHHSVCRPGINLATSTQKASCMSFRKQSEKVTIIQESPYCLVFFTSNFNEKNSLI